MALLAERGRGSADEDRQPDLMPDGAQPRLVEEGSDIQPASRWEVKRSGTALPAEIPSATDLMHKVRRPGGSGGSNSGGGKAHGAGAVAWEQEDADPRLGRSGGSKRALQAEIVSNVARPPKPPKPLSALDDPTQPVGLRSSAYRLDHNDRVPKHTLPNCTECRGCNTELSYMAEQTK